MQSAPELVLPGTVLWDRRGEVVPEADVQLLGIVVENTGRGSGEVPVRTPLRPKAAMQMQADRPRSRTVK